MSTQRPSRKRCIALTYGLRVTRAIKLLEQYIRKQLGIDLVDERSTAYAVGALLAIVGLAKVSSGEESSCFEAGTLVRMVNESAAIEEVRVGDVVLSELALGVSPALMAPNVADAATSREIVILILDESFASTEPALARVNATDRLWTEHGWREAWRLEAGERVRQRSGGWGQIVRVDP